MKLRDTQLRQAKPKEKTYRLPDGLGLYLVVAPSGNKYWQHRYKLRGKGKTKSYGPYPAISLQEARVELLKDKELIAKRGDPCKQHQVEKQQAYFDANNTFEAVAREWHSSQASRWKGKQPQNIIRSLEKRVFPVMGGIAITEITTPQILKLLRDMESQGLGDATRRVRQRVSSVFTFAMAEGRLNYNPTVGLEKALRPLPTVVHRRRLELSELGGFMAALEGDGGQAQTKLGLELIILTFVRTSEMRYAEWSDIDLDNARWVIPAHKIKMKRDHVVPLSRQALDVLKRLHKLNGNREKVIFSHSSKDGAVSENTFLGVVERLGYKEKTTVHGFRGTASTALNEAGFKPDIIEIQLSHVESNQSKAAYDGAEHMQYRVDMMQWWADKVGERIEGD